MWDGGVGGGGALLRCATEAYAKAVGGLLVETHAQIDKHAHGVSHEAAERE